MSKIEKFEDLIAWQKAGELTKEIYAMCRQESLNKDFGLKDQIQRTAVSTMANLAEGLNEAKGLNFINLSLSPNHRVQSCGHIFTLP